MSVNQLKVVVSVLKEVSEGNIPTSKDYGIEDRMFYDIIDAMQDEGLIKGARFSRGGVGNPILIAMLDSVKITIKGMEYLNQNSTLVKTYKGLKVASGS
nr:YjcQ family protein [uncultured Niameybacter sp.]